MRLRMIVPTIYVKRYAVSHTGCSRREKIEAKERKTTPWQQQIRTPKKNKPPACVSGALLFLGASLREDLKQTH